MFLVFGHGRFVTKKGVALSTPRECRRCHATAPWVLIRMRDWIDLYHVPLFPVGVRYALACPCGRSAYALTQNEAECVLQGEEPGRSSPARRSAKPARMSRAERRDAELANRAKAQMRAAENESAK